MVVASEDKHLHNKCSYLILLSLSLSCWALGRTVLNILLVTCPDCVPSTPLADWPSWGRGCWTDSPDAGPALLSDSQSISDIKTVLATCAKHSTGWTAVGKVHLMPAWPHAGDVPCKSKNICAFPSYAGYSAFISCTPNTPFLPKQPFSCIYHYREVRPFWLSMYQKH